MSPRSLRRIPAALLTAFYAFGQPAPATAAPRLVAVGPTFTVNQDIAGPQTFGSVAVNTQGQFLVTWSSMDPATLINHAAARLYRADGSPASAEIALPRIYGAPTGAIDEAGNAVVLDLFFAGTVQAHRIRADGTPTTSLAVTSYPATAMSVATGVDGGFIVIWVDNSTLWMRRYDSQDQTPFFAVPLTGSASPGSSGIGSRPTPHIAAVPGGGYLVTWLHSSGGTRARFLFADGSTDGPELTLPLVSNDFSLGAVDGAGNFWLVYRGEAGMPPAGRAVHLVRYDRQGQVLVEATAAAENDGDRSNSYPALGVDGQGNLLAAWELDELPGSSYDSVVRLLGPDGAPLSPVLALGPLLPQQQRWPSVAGLPDGFVVLWHTNDGHNLGLKAQRFAVESSTAKR